VALTWIDVQGHEAAVLAGGAAVFEKQIPLFVEHWPYGLRTGSGLDKLDLDHEELIFSSVTTTVLFSIVAHGVTASPLARRYASIAADPTKCPEEHAPVIDDPLRRPAVGEPK
jgi:NhaP-type Na+/H+ or K+/H+ antiporter